MNQDDRLGPYRLLRRLGEGGMGVVHLAVDSKGRQVAVKVLRAEVAGDDVARRRLSREVETMRRVRSRYIAEVLDADVTGHRPYIVTRYVPGRPLDEIVKEDGPLDLPALTRLAHGVAAALAAVHSVGVIHRDLKPGNVLILDGQPVLIDFGIAQAVDATRLTQTGMFIGTPGYLAPEIIEGQEAGPEVDVHAWAGTLLFAGTGLPPFGKGTLEMIFYNITAGKADISAIPAQLQPLLKAAFQRNPAKRPKAAELAEQTARLLPKTAGNVPDEISTVPRAERTPPPAELPTPHLSSPQFQPQPSGEAKPYVSLLPGQVPPPAAPGQAPSGPPPGQVPPGAGDPWPTRRVSPEELRQMREEPHASSAPSTPWAQVPQQPGNSHGRPEVDVPTRRVRQEAPDYGRGTQPPPYVPANVPQQAPPSQYPPDPSTKREPYIPAARPGSMTQRSRAYGAAGAMLLVLMIVLAALAPLVVAALAIPVAVLLRAADLAQHELSARRSTGAAALDVIRVFAYPAALAKSFGITVALVLYALILGLPVTLLLAVLVRMPSSNALAWGAAIALWTICAGPGVEGPGRQMRRTLASLVPSRAAAMTVAGALGAVAVLSLLLAYGTVREGGREATWTPIDVGQVVEKLDDLKGNATK